MARPGASRSTHEDLMRYVMGENYLDELAVESGEKPVVRHVRGMLGPAQVILMSVGCFLATVALLFSVYPRSLFYVGLVPTPVPMDLEQADTQGGDMATFLSEGLTVDLDRRTRLEWADGDFRHVLRYKASNSGTLYHHPTLTLKLLGGDGELLDRLAFTVGDGMVPPGGEVEGMLFWGRDAAGGKAVAFRILLTVSSTEGDTLTQPGDESSPTQTPGAGASVIPDPATPAEGDIPSEVSPTPGQ